MAYSSLSYGSSGDEVKKLQRTLNSKGYSLSVDGVFGKNTQSAVKDYQKKNGLNVDGIVGAKTWTSLDGAEKTTSTNKLSEAPAIPEAARPTYTKSDAVISAEKDVAQWETNKPQEYKSKYSDKIDAILDSVLNREQFSYNLSDDPLYDQYRDLYMRNGKKAMQDAIGSATALTGGYSNSYAETVGYEAYDEYLDELNSIALDLRDRAYDMYQDEGDKLISDITLLRSLDGDDYEKYLGVLEQYYKDGDYLLDKLAQMSDAEFEEFLADVDAWENDRDYQFKKYQDDKDREEFREEMDFKKAEAERDQANEDRNYYLSLSRGSSSEDDKDDEDEKDTNDKYVIYPKSYNEFVSVTGYGGIMTENIFYDSSTLMKKYGSYQNYLKEMYKKYS